MPEGILDFFEPVWMETQSLGSRESKKVYCFLRNLGQFAGYGLDDKPPHSDVRGH